MFELIKKFNSLNVAWHIIDKLKDNPLKKNIYLGSLKNNGLEKKL